MIIWIVNFVQVVGIWKLRDKCLSYVSLEGSASPKPDIEHGPEPVPYVVRPHKLYSEHQSLVYFLEVGLRDLHAVCVSVYPSH
jgi:hypothetical protein